MLKLVLPSYNNNVISREHDNYDTTETCCHPIDDDNNDLDDNLKPLRFEKRRVPRALTRGWARIACCDPFHIFMGGSSRIIDINDTSVGLLSNTKIAEGEIVEVQMAPFRVRGKFGVVVRTEKLSDYNDTADGQLYKIAVRFGKQNAA